MSIPQIFLTASGSSRPSTTQNDSQRIQSFNLPTTSKEHIRERLNLHVKKRIQSHDQPQYPMLSTSPTTSLYATTASALKPTHPFLMTGASMSMPPVMVFANSLISVASNYRPDQHYRIGEHRSDAGRPMLIPQIDRPLSKMKQQPKKMTKKKRSATIKKKTKHADANQQADNLILNTKFSDDSNDYHDRNDNSLNGSISTGNGDSPPIPSDKADAKLINTPDILSMVLSLKKNALMHDPYVIQFISAIR